jgi:hypothetical protein
MQTLSSPRRSKPQKLPLTPKEMNYSVCIAFYVAAVGKPSCVFFLPCILWALCHMAPLGLAASCGVGTSRSGRDGRHFPCGPVQCVGATAAGHRAHVRR